MILLLKSSLLVYITDSYFLKSVFDLNIGLPSGFNPKHQRIRCQGHIINLAVDAFLSIKDKDLIDTTEDNRALITLEELQKWRKSGPLGRLHILTIKIHSSPQLLQKFKAISGGLTVPRDNSTRWLSWHKTIERGLQLREAIDRFYDLCIEDDPDRLMEEDWKTLKKVSSDSFTYIYSNK